MNQSLSEVMQNQSNSLITFVTQLKTASEHHSNSNSNNNHKLYTDHTAENPALQICGIPMEVTSIRSASTG